MYEVPKPELLDPDRVNRDHREHFTNEDHRSQAQLLAEALGESCAYANQLWEQVDTLRGYLLDSLPPDPRTPGPHTTAAASPTGPDDDEGWLRWINAFATTTSVLCGAHGDSGFGLSRGREEAHLRRTAPELNLLARHPGRGSEKQQPDPAPQSSAAQQRDPQDGSNSARRSPSATAVKAAGAVVVAFFALRGLRSQPRPRRSSESCGE